VHAHNGGQPEADEDVSDLPLDGARVGVVGGGGGEKQGRRHKRLELHKMGKP